MLRGKPLEALPAFWREHGVTSLVFESDTEPYAKERDAAVRALAEADGLRVESPCGHTLYDPALLLSLCKGKMPITYKVFPAASCSHMQLASPLRVHAQARRLRIAHVTCRCAAAGLQCCTRTPIDGSIVRLCLLQGFEKLTALAGAPPKPLPDAPAQLPRPSPAALAADTGVPGITEIGGYTGEPTTHFKALRSRCHAREQLTVAVDTLCMDWDMPVLRDREARASPFRGWLSIWRTRRGWRHSKSPKRTPQPSRSQLPPSFRHT